MSPREFAFGDRLIHAAKPEWGVGQVLTAQGVTHEGNACQRLQIRFERAGLKTISTGVADLRPASAADTPPEPSEAAEIDLSDPQTAMSQLPESTRDPFAALECRLEATLKQYEYAPTGGSLLDWAAVQSGLADPLTRFSRHELESYFERFRHSLDQHLRELVRELRRTNPSGLAEVTARASGAGLDAVKRANTRR